MTKVVVPQMAWYGDTELELAFPEQWDISVQRMSGCAREPLDKEKMRQSFDNPLGTRRIRELAQDKKEVAIVFDDLSRPTKAHEIIPFVLEELEAAGIKENQIRFIAALGAHGAMTREQLAKKLGEDIVSNYRVYNHNPYENCVTLGFTSRGTKVAINAGLMGCDLKIAIGSVTPHPLNGFGGGGKIILPGVASMDTIEDNHKLIAKPGMSGLHPTAGLGKYEDNIMRLDINEACRMVGLDIKIDALVNTRRETVALFVGDAEKVHEAGIELGKELYKTVREEDCDIAVVNAHAKVNEAAIALNLGIQSLKKEGGDVVIITHTPEGQIPHYLIGCFGSDLGGRMYSKRRRPAHLKRIIVYSPFVFKADEAWYGPEEIIEWARTWDEVLELLSGKFDGAPKVAVYPDATIQYFG
ncbi:MAG: DUF2088 domain-containing protein [Dethiobacter sp.]|nr:DUF2088 domain-containing protein [Dethiobacter sp.]